jgi:hypothetical protein
MTLPRSLAGLSADGWLKAEAAKPCRTRTLDKAPLISITYRFSTATGRASSCARLAAARHRGPMSRHVPIVAASYCPKGTADSEAIPTNRRLWYGFWDALEHVPVGLNRHQSRSSPRKRGSRAKERKIWIPACAGMSGTCSREEDPGQVKVSLANFAHLDSNSRGRPSAGQWHNPFGNVRLR